MTEWPILRLDEVADRVAVKNSAGHDRVMTVSAEQGLVEQEKFFNKRVASADLSGYLVVEPGDFVYNKSTSINAPWGVVARYEGDGPGVVTSLYIVFRAQTEVVDSAFMLLACNASAFFDSLRGTLREGARAHGLLNVRLGEFFGAKVQVPTLPEQRHIVDVVAAVDSQIETLTIEIERARRATTALRETLLEPKAHWKSVRIDEVATPATGRAFSERYQGVPSGVLPYFKVADMNAVGNERKMRTAPNWLTAESAAHVKPRICPAGTIVFPIIGAALRTEKRRVLVRPSAFDQNVMGLILGDRVSSEFMFAVMSSVRLGDQSQTGAVPSVNQGLVSAIQFALPPLHEQEEIGARLRSFYEMADAATDELARLRMFRSALLAALLNQAIEISDSYDDDLGAVS